MQLSHRTSFTDPPRRGSPHSLPLAARAAAAGEVQLLQLSPLMRSEGITRGRKTSAPVTW
jgi:hypothetical protein